MVTEIRKSQWPSKISVTQFDVAKYFEELVPGSSIAGALTNPRTRLSFSYFTLGRREITNRKENRTVYTGQGTARKMGKFFAQLTPQDGRYNA